VGRITVLDEIAIADCALQLDGADLDDLFTTAVQALAAVMVDPETLPVTVERTLTLAAPSLDLLLYDWLSEMIYVKDAEQIVFTRAAVHVDEAPPRLRARLGGGRLDPPRTALRADAKAVTLHAFALEQRDGGWRARVVIDI
jgi:protein archease